MRFFGVSLIVFLSLFYSPARALADGVVPGYDRALRDAVRLSDLGNYAQAISILESAISQAARENKSEWEASMLGVLGSIYQRAGRFDEAERALNRAIYQWTQLNGPATADLVGPLGNLGGLYYEAGQYSRAEKLMSKALTIEASSGGAPSVTAMLLTNLGNVYFREHKNTLAKKSAEEALNELALVDNPRDAPASDYTLLGALYLRSGDFTEAESFLQRALTLWQSTRGAHERHSGEGLANLAIFYCVRAEYEKAERLFEQAQEIFQTEGADDAFLGHFLIEYSAVERKLGHKKEAKQLTRQSERLIAASAQSTISRGLVDVSAFRAGK